MTQAVLSAEFYGASYAVFPPFDATAHFDITLKFRTDFGDGLLLFAGSALQVGTSLEQYSLPNIIPLITNHYSNGMLQEDTVG